jgi:hypothetical protein
MATLVVSKKARPRSKWVLKAFLTQGRPSTKTFRVVTLEEKPFPNPRAASLVGLRFLKRLGFKPQPQ